MTEVRRNISLVPLAKADFQDGALRVPYSKSEVQNARTTTPTSGPMSCTLRHHAGNVHYGTVCDGLPGSGSAS